MSNLKIYLYHWRITLFKLTGFRRLKNHVFLYLFCDRRFIILFFIISFLSSRIIFKPLHFIIKVGLCSFLKIVILLEVSGWRLSIFKNCLNVLKFVLKDFILNLRVIIWFIKILKFFYYVPLEIKRVIVFLGLVIFLFLRYTNRVYVFL